MAFWFYRLSGCKTRKCGICLEYKSCQLAAKSFFFVLHLFVGPVYKMYSIGGHEFNYNDSSMVFDDDLSYSRGTFVTSSGSGVSKYCLPRSISALESMVPILDEISDVPLEDKSSIWTMSYKSPVIETNLNFASPISSPQMGPNGYNYYHQRKRLSVSSWRESPEILHEYLRDVRDSDEYASSGEYQRESTKPFTREREVSIRKDRECASHYPASRIDRGYTRETTSQLTFRTYKGSIFTVPENSKFFIIKSYSILDVNASFTNNIWTSTELGNRRLNKAFIDLKAEKSPGKVFLLFLVNTSGKFCGIAEMIQTIDFTKSSDIWVEQQRWKGIFPVDWLLIKDVPNRFFQHLRVPSNEYKPVTNSRDTQEIPFDVGVSMLKIVSAFKS
jgi:YT521-B-like family.